MPRYTTATSLARAITPYPSSTTTAMWSGRYCATATSASPIYSPSSPTGGRVRSTANATAEQSTLISHNGRFAVKSRRRVSRFPNPTGICIEGSIERAGRPQAVSGQNGCNTNGPSQHRSREDAPLVSLQPAMRGVDLVSDGHLQKGRERGST